MPEPRAHDDRRRFHRATHANQARRAAARPATQSNPPGCWIWNCIPPHYGRSAHSNAASTLRSLQSSPLSPPETSTQHKNAIPNTHPTHLKLNKINELDKRVSGVLGVLGFSSPRVGKKAARSTMILVHFFIRTHAPARVNPTHPTHTPRGPEFRGLTLCWVRKTTQHIPNTPNTLPGRFTSCAPSHGPNCPRSSPRAWLAPATRPRAHPARPRKGMGAGRTPGPQGRRTPRTDGCCRPSRELA